MAVHVRERRQLFFKFLFQICISNFIVGIGGVLPYSDEGLTLETSAFESLYGG